MTIQVLTALWCGRYPKQKDRIQRGAQLALSGQVDLMGGFAYVKGTGVCKWYTVKPGSCECADHKRRPEYRCKHRWAASLVARIDNI